MHSFHFFESSFQSFFKFLLAKLLPITFSKVLLKMYLHSLVITPMLSYKLFEVLISYLINSKNTLHYACIPKLKHVHVLNA